MVNRQILHRNAKRGAGGVALLFKKSLQKGIHVLNVNQQDVIWCRLEAQFFSMKADVYVCFVYIPPADSSVFSYTDQDYWSSLEEQIAKFSQKGEVLIMGDMNARTANIPDFHYRIDSTRDDQFSNPIRSGDVPQNRQSRDTKHNCQGKLLCNLCKTTTLKILNGRHNGDTLGEYTCIKTQGSSVVDYALATAPLIHQISHFLVEE